MRRVTSEMILQDLMLMRRPSVPYMAPVAGRGAGCLAVGTRPALPSPALLGLVFVVAGAVVMMVVVSMLVVVVVRVLVVAPVAVVFMAGAVMLVCRFWYP